MKKISIQGSTSMSIIPCYDGRTLAGVQKVVKDGLSVISIKQSHRNCQFLTDPITKLPQLSCAQGIKARNSFWDLHKPDLRKVKGLECATSESVTQMLRAHSEENAEKPTYKRKLLRLLGSLVTKKTISPTEICVLQNGSSWPMDTCVLSSICRETEIKRNGVVGTQTLTTMGFNANIEDISRDQTVSTSLFENHSFIVIEHEDSPFKTDVEISLPSSSTRPCDFDFYYENIDNMIASDIKIQSPCSKDLEADDESDQIKPQPIQLSYLNLKSKSSHLKTSISSQCVSNLQSNEIYVTDNETNTDDTSLTPTYQNSQSKVNSFQKENEININLPPPTEEMMQSVLSEMLKDMKDIEDYVSAYISSFCILEEEFDNYAAIKNSSEVVSQFLNEIQSPCKDINVETNEDLKCERKNGQDKVCTIKNDQKSSFALEQSEENYLKERLNQKVSSYCYWDDEATLTSFEIEGTTSNNHFGKVISEENSPRSNTALIPSKFFGDIRKNLLESFLNDVTIEDFSQYKYFNDAAFLRPSASVYDPNALEEAETMAQAVETFLNSCFYADHTRHNNIPCSIIELGDDFDEPFNDGERTCGIVNQKSESNCKILNTQDEWNEGSRILKTHRTIINKNDTSSKSNENFFNRPTPNNEIESASCSGSNIPHAPLMDNTHRDVNSGCERCIQSANNSVEEMGEILTNYDISNKNSGHFKTENLSVKCPKTCKQKPRNIQFSTVSSPLNVHKTGLCSSEYREKPQNTLGNSPEESIPSELSEKSSNKCRSRFVHVQEESQNNSTKTNSNYLFSSPNVQLNLTNPLSDEKK